MTKVNLGPSSIQGTGVFANQDFSEGAEILTIDDSHLVTNESELSKEDLEYNADYFDGKIIIMQEPERCINHSCDPNSYVKTIKGVRKVIALKPIHKDQEITFDYAVNGDNDGTFPCHCGAARCRKIYQGNFFKLPLPLQLEYLPYLDDWFVTKHQAEIFALKNLN